ncbi:MAG: NADH-quinone oxidoreductase subunit A [Candidatus Omnitrophota bacterium]|jgi:NADH-quinone oxidoreductase subunit A|nr:MAG: NADH-quinone oxidoreductase subunit A [Candidatus Omnitrophota bacterium]
MPAQFIAALIFLLAAIAFVAFNVLVPRLFRPIRPDQEKLSNYECGERPIGGPWIRFNIRFYIIAIIFLIFDVEVLFIIPWAVVYRRLYSELGMLVFWEMFVFLTVLGVGLAYCWVKGHLEWVFRDKLAEDKSKTLSS